MSVQSSEINLQLRQLLDALILIAMLWLAHAIRYNLNGWNGLPEIEPFSQFAWLIVVLLPFAPLILEMHGFYDRVLEKSWVRSLRQIVQTMVWLGCMVGCCVVFLRLALPSRAVPLSFVPLGTVALLLTDRLWVTLLRSRAENGRFKERVILAGNEREVAALESSLSPTQRLTLEICERFDLENQPLAELVRALHEHSVERVIFVGGTSSVEHIERAVQACDLEGVEAWLMADFIRTTVSRPDWATLDGRPVLVFSSRPGNEWALLCKRLIDVIGSGVGLVVLSPLFLVLTLWIRMSSPGPAIFRQKRGGAAWSPLCDAEVSHDVFGRGGEAGGVAQAE